MLLGLQDKPNYEVLITPASASHFLCGYLGIVCCNYIGVSYRYSLVLLLFLHTIYEIKDYYYTYIHKGKESYWANNSFYNSLGDTVVFIIGMLLARETNYTSEQLNVSIGLFLLLFIIYIYTVPKWRIPLD